MSKLERFLEGAREHLEPGESILGAVLGAYETKILGQDTARKGVLIATSHRVLFFAKKLTGFELESFPYENISSFEQGKSMMGQRVSMFASGNKVAVKWINDPASLATVVEAVNARMGKPRTPTSQPNAIESDVMGQLKQLGDLRDAGVLTDEEFNAKKKSLLDRL